MDRLTETLQDKSQHLRCPNYVGNYDRSLVRLMKMDRGYPFEREVTETEVVMVWEGKVELKLDGTEVKSIGKGQMFFLPPGSRISVEVVEATTIIVINVDLTKHECGLFRFSSLVRFKDEIKNSFNPLEIRSSLKIFLSGMMPFLEDGLLCSNYLKAKITEFLHIFKNYYTEREQAEFLYPLLGEDMNFNNFIEKHIRTVKTVEELAHIANMSRTGFIDKFKRKMKQSPTVYILNRRLELIRADLNNINLPLKEVATRNGYNHYDVFSKFCKRNLGMSPSDYRESLK